MSNMAVANQDYGGQTSARPKQKFRQVVAGEAITKGQAVTFYKSGSTMDGVRAYITTAATDFVCGIAQHDAAIYAPLLIQAKGLGEVAITTDESAEAAYGLTPAASGAVTGTAAGTVTNNAFGYVLVADADTTLAAGEYVLNCWW